jgi:glycosyltransferase involved in cell wall biosynthesis
MTTTSPEAAVVQDWFLPAGGSERVALELARLLPDATVYTSFFDRSVWGHEIDPGRVRAWPLQGLRGLSHRHRSLLPLYPVWFASLDLRRYDLVVSNSTAFAKAVRTRRGALHVGYIHTPMRYAWDLDRYLAGSSISAASRIAARALAPALRRWDVATSHRPDVLVASTEAVRARIHAAWHRDAEVIHPPVDVGGIRLSTRDDGYLLVAARMVAYRRIDLAVEAATRLGRDLVVVGEGPEDRRLRSLAGRSVHFVGRVDRTILLDLFERCHAYLVPGEEDFGIAPVEAMAAGKPVVAFRAGGALETVVDGVTGLFFDHLTPRALGEAIERLDTMTFDPGRIRTNAQRFDLSMFRGRWRELFARLGVDRRLYAP